MKKITYPSEGIYTYCKTYLSNSLTGIKTAVGYTNNFSIPTDFTYKSYLYNLSNTLIKFQNEIASIDTVISTIDDDYESLSDRLNSAAGKLSSNEVNKIIPERERLIK